MMDDTLKKEEGGESIYYLVSVHIELSSVSSQRPHVNFIT